MPVLKKIVREIVLDTETTGFKARAGDRIVEIGCLELIGHLPTGNRFHTYVNPERDVPQDAVNVHGLTEEFLSGYPVFSSIVDEFLEFIGDSPLIIHNASFDMGFLNAELERLSRTGLPLSRAVDTVALARKRFPGAPASLDALCKRFGIDNASRTLHGALLDAQLLAEVYLELLGGRQQGLDLHQDPARTASALPAGSMAAAASCAPAAPAASLSPAPPARPRRFFAPSEAELAAHRDLIGRLKNPLWTQDDAADGAP